LSSEKSPGPRGAGLLSARFDVARPVDDQARVLPGDVGLKGRDAWMPRCQLAADLVGQRQSGLENRRNRMPSFPFETGAARYSRMRTSETTAKHSEHSLLLLAVSGCYFAAEFTKKRGFLRQTSATGCFFAAFNSDISQSCPVDAA